jgi:hypothetical protein
MTIKIAGYVEEMPPEVPRMGCKFCFAVSVPFTVSTGQPEPEGLVCEGCMVAAKRAGVAGLRERPETVIRRARLALEHLKDDTVFKIDIRKFPKTEDGHDR